MPLDATGCDSEHGRTVIVPTTGETGYVGSVHYCGPLDGSGVITLAMVDGRNVAVAASTYVLAGIDRTL